MSQPGFLPYYSSPTLPAGGSGGESFCDDLTNVMRVTMIRVRADEKLVHALQFRYYYAIGGGRHRNGEDWGEQHGGNGGTAREVVLKTGEYIESVRVWAQTYVEQLAFYGPDNHRLMVAGNPDTKAPMTTFKAGRLKEGLVQLPVVGGAIGAAKSYLDSVGFLFPIVSVQTGADMLAGLAEAPVSR